MSVHRDVDDELRFHFESRIEELVQEGQSRDDARSQAISEFGDVDEVRHGLRAIDARVARRRSRLDQVEAVTQDLKYAARSLLRSAGVSLTIILTLALGIGVNAAVFSLLDVIYLRPPAGIASPEGLRRLWIDSRFRNGREFWPGFDYQGFEAAARAVRGRADAFAYRPPSKVRIGRGENAPVVRVVSATGRYFEILGVKPARGRFFGSDEAAPETSARVMVISDAFWARQFARDPNVLGQYITLGRTLFVIIGIAHPEFRGIDLDAAEAWIPLGALNTPNSAKPWWRNSNVNGFQLVVRLKEQTREEELLAPMMAALRGAGEPGYARYDSTSAPAFGAINRERGPGKVSGELQVAKRLAGVTLLVLLIAVANVVNLLLARAMHRRREIAVRLALGISQMRLTRLLVSESMLLALVATFVATIASIWGSALIQHLLMPDLQWSASMLDRRLIAFALAVAIVSGTVTGLVPALQMTSPNLTEGLRSGARDTRGRRSRLRDTLVAVQAAMSVVLLVGAVLFIRSLSNVKAHDIGYAVDRLAFGQVDYDTRDSVRDALLPSRMRALVPRISAIAGVRDVAFTSMRPKSGFASVTYFPASDTARHKPPLGMWTAVTPNYFDVTGTHLLRGHTFAANGADGASSVIVNQAMAEALWPNEDPIGRCIRFDELAHPCVSVIGVVATAMLSAIDEPPNPSFYVSADDAPFSTWGGSSVIVNADKDHLVGVANALRDILRAEFPGGIPSATTMTAVMAPNYRPWTIGAKLFTVFGLLALLVASIGVYSSVSYAVSQRTHEFGVRMALGAHTADVLRLVVGEGLKVVAAGTLIGVVLSLLAGKVIGSLLYGVQPSDPFALSLAPSVLLLVAIAAALRPALRASRADPVSALRAE